jgi:hypothetical protein
MPSGSDFPHPSGGFGGFGGFGGQHSGAAGAQPTAAPSFSGAQGPAPSGAFGGFQSGPAAAPSGFQTLRRV